MSSNAEPTDPKPGRFPIRQFVRPQAITISPECTVGELAQVFQANQISGVPVVDHHNRLVGVVSQTDIAQYLAQLHCKDPRRPILAGLPHNLMDSGKVSDILTPFYCSVSLDTDLCEVVRLMLEYQIHRLPVMQDDAVVGVVTTLDVLRVFHDMLCNP